MKKYLLMMTVLVLLLTACGQKPTPPAEQKSTTPPAAQTAEQKAETPPVQSEASAESGFTGLPDRPAVEELKFMQEGMEETVPVTLYESGGWSVYIPDEGWRLEEREMDDGVFQTGWESIVNDDAELRVLSMGQRTLAEGQKWLRWEEDDFAFQEDEQGGLWGSDAEDRMLMEVRFYSGADALYAVLWTYPEAAVEGFGTRLRVMADTFEIKNP